MPKKSTNKNKPLNFVNAVNSDISDIFHMVNSDIFNILCQIINEIYNGAQLTQNEILQRFAYCSNAEKKTILNIIQAVFIFASSTNNKTAIAHLYVNSPIILPPTTEELIWLKYMLNNAEISFLLPAELRRKLKKRLANIPEQPKYLWKPIHNVGDNIVDTAYQKKLTIIWQALQEHKHLQYSINNQKLKSLIPHRLEYDAAAHVYRLIAWQEDSQRAVKLPIQQLNQLSISDINYDAKTTKLAFDSYLHTHRHTVEFRIKPQNNVVERAFALLAAYEKEAQYDEHSNTYHILMYYYSFDETEVIEQLLSLGSSVHILSSTPPNLRQTIINIWQQALAHYE